MQLEEAERQANKFQVMNFSSKIWRTLLIFLLLFPLYRPP
jgi:hypothetical protein